MGCAHSTLPRQLRRAEESAPVAHCRDRAALLAEAIRRRYELADAHRAYAASLRAAGAGLHDFLRAVQDAAPQPPRQQSGPAAGVRLPAPRKRAGAEPQLFGDGGDDGGHIRFPPDVDEEEIESETEEGEAADPEEAEEEPPVPVPEEPIQPASPAPLQYGYDYGYAPPPPYTYGPPPYTYGPDSGSSSYAYGGADMGGGGGGYNLVSSINYARSEPPSPALSYAHLAQDTTADVLHRHQYHHDGPAGRPALPPSSDYGGGQPYQYQYPQTGGFSPPPVAAASSSYQLPPPTPSPPRAPTWDLLNPFEAFQTYYPELPSAAMVSYNSTIQSSTDPREDDDDDDDDDDEDVDDDMPELEEISELQEEDDDDLGEVDVVEEQDKCAVEDAKQLPEEEDKCAVEDAKQLPEEEEKRPSSAGASEEEMDSKSMLSADNRSVVRSEESSDAGGSTVSNTVDHAPDNTDVVEEEQLKDSDEQLKDSDDVADEPPVVPPVNKVYHDDVQVVQEMKLQFDRACMSADDLCKALEAGKTPYNSGPKVPSMIFCGFTKMGKKPLLFEEEYSMKSGNLSSTLQKLYMWETKLLQELKAQEKIRVIYVQKYEERKFLYNTGAENHKLEAADIYIRKLATKISVAFQVIKSISNKINKLRDEELWPQTHELIKGFMQMWHTMLECNQIQCHALSQARNIDCTIAAASFGEAQIDLVKKLELQLLDMTTSFVVWFNAQRSYTSTLNEWLKKGVGYVPEVTEDGVAPFSPGRLGAPPIFTICNWAASMARISQTEIVGTMHAFASSVLHIWERQRSEWKHVMLADTDIGYLRWMERDEMWTRKVVEERNKKLVLVSSQCGISSSALHDSVSPADASLQSCMHGFFEAMETFAGACTEAYKGLLLRAEEEEKESG